MFTFIQIQKLACLALTVGLMMALSTPVEAAPRGQAKTEAEKEKASKARMRNKALLLKKTQQRVAVVPPTPEQNRLESEKRRL